MRGSGGCQHKDSCQLPNLSTSSSALPGRLSPRRNGYFSWFPHSSLPHISVPPAEINNCVCKDIWIFSLKTITLTISTSAYSVQQKIFVYWVFGWFHHSSSCSLSVKFTFVKDIGLIQTMQCDVIVSWVSKIQYIQTRHLLMCIFDFHISPSKIGYINLFVMSKMEKLCFWIHNMGRLWFVSWLLYVRVIETKHSFQRKNLAFFCKYIVAGKTDVPN